MYFLAIAVVFFFPFRGEEEGRSVTTALFAPLVMERAS